MPVLGLGQVPSGDHEGGVSIVSGTVLSKSPSAVITVTVRIAPSRGWLMRSSNRVYAKSVQSAGDRMPGEDASLIAAAHAG